MWNPFRSAKLWGICYWQNKVVPPRDNTVEAESASKYQLKKTKQKQNKASKKVCIVISICQNQIWQMFWFLVHIFVPFFDSNR